MRSTLLKAKELLAKGDPKGALDLLKSLSKELKGYVTHCPGCGADITVLEKNECDKGECAKCGAVIGSKKLVKATGGDNMTKKQILESLWELYRKSDPEADAFSINSYAATGWLKKSLAVKLGLPLPEEKLEKAIPPEIKAKIEAKKEAAVKKSEYPTREDILDTMLKMIKNHEAPELIHRRSLTKFEATGEASDDVLKTVFRKLDMDFYALNKSGVQANEEIMHPDEVSYRWSVLADKHNKTLKDAKAKGTKVKVHVLNLPFGNYVHDIEHTDESFKKTTLVDESKDGVKRGKDSLPEKMEGKEELQDTHVGPLKPAIVKK